MIATNSNNIRNNFNDVCNKIVQDSDIAVITIENAENVILMSQSQYENMLEKFTLEKVKTTMSG